MSTAFVTGASGEIGSAIAIKLSRAGFDVALGYNNSRKSAKDTAEKIICAGSKAEIFQCDISNPVSITDTVESIGRTLGDISLLVNCAGCADINLFTDLTDEKVLEIINTDLVGSMLCAKHCLKNMISKKRGNIINISSVWGEVGASCEVAYSTAKAGIIGFTKALAKEVAPSGIRVNCVSPGMINTKMNSCLSDTDISQIVGEISMCRMGSSDEIADTVAFLASEKSSYITGQTIRCDGGWI